MNKLEKRICLAAFVFIALYVGAIALTLHSRDADPPAELSIESVKIDAGTRHMILAEVLPPMLVLLILTICFIFVRKKQHHARLRLDTLDDSGEEKYWHATGDTDGAEK